MHALRALFVAFALAFGFAAAGAGALACAKHADAPKAAAEAVPAIEAVPPAAAVEPAPGPAVSAAPAVQPPACDQGCADCASECATPGCTLCKTMPAEADPMPDACVAGRVVAQGLLQDLTPVDPLGQYRPPNAL